MCVVDLKAATLTLVAAAGVARALSVLEQEFVGLPAGHTSNVVIGVVAVGIAHAVLRFFTGRWTWVPTDD